MIGFWFYIYLFLRQLFGDYIYLVYILIDNFNSKREENEYFYELNMY